jgi:hypothetical protein
VIARALALGLCLAAPATLAAQSEPPSKEAPSPSAPTTTRDVVLFLAGGAAGLGLHEGGHLIFATLFDVDPGIKSVHFGPIPFFAITHTDVSPAREFTIASAGFWMQHASSEWLLTRRRRLRDERAPLAKGVLAFNIAASVAYATAAFGTFGPDERDTRAMADALDVREPWIGGLILAPAALDAWRYLNPDARWAVWMSRAAKLGAVLLVVRAAAR